jgi:O-glycosyl hydrolase
VALVKKDNTPLKPDAREDNPQDLTFPVSISQTADTDVTRAIVAEPPELPPPEIPPQNGAVITVNTAVKYQYVRGFGGMDLPWGNVKALSIQDYETMYDPDKLGYNIMRIMVLPDNTDPGKTLDNIIKGGRPNYVEGVKIVNKYGGYVLATPWSPPAAWKSNDSANGGGYLKKENYQDYADYLKSFCQIMAERGAPIYVISIQNEPNYFADGYAGCEWEPEDMRAFFKEVGHFTDGAQGYGGGQSMPSVRTMNGESANVVTIHNSALADTQSRDAMDLLGRHLYGYQQQKLSNLYGKEIWMTEYNINSGNDNPANDWTWNYVWKFMNSIDVSIRLNDENAFIWWTAKRFYSMLGDGYNNTTEGAVLPRGHGLSHYAKFASNTNRVGVNVSGTTANINHGTFSDGEGSSYVTSVKVTAYESLDGNSISLVMFSTTRADGTNGINMGTVKIQLPSGFIIGSATAMRSNSDLKSQKEDVTIGEDRNSAYVTLPAGTILSVLFKK